MKKTTKQILLVALSLFVCSFGWAQEANENEENSKYIRDRTDPYKPFGNGFQLQINAISEIDDPEYEFSLPDLYGRYSFNDKFVISAGLAYQHYYIDDFIDHTAGLGRYRLDAIYALSEDFKVGPFKEFTILWNNNLANDADESFKTTALLNWVSEMGERTEFDFNIGYTHSDGVSGLPYNIELDWYLTEDILLEIGNDGTYFFGDVDEDFETNLFTEISFLSTGKYQFNLYAETGLNTPKREIGIRTAYSIMKN